MVPVRDTGRRAGVGVRGRQPTAAAVAETVTVGPRRQAGLVLPLPPRVAAREASLEARLEVPVTGAGDQVAAPPGANARHASAIKGAAVASPA